VSAAARCPEVAEGELHRVDQDRFPELWDRIEEAYLERLLAAISPHETWRDRLRAGAAETARLAEEHPAVTRFLAVDALAVGDPGHERQRRLADRLAALLDSARMEVPDPDRVPELTGSWVVAMFFDTVYRRCTVPGSPSLPSQLPELMFLATSAYFGTEAGLEELIREE
jgi:hypothetical protein